VKNIIFNSYFFFLRQNLHEKCVAIAIYTYFKYYSLSILKQKKNISDTRNYETITSIWKGKITKNKSSEHLTINFILSIYLPMVRFKKKQIYDE
jgi:hypothetical protein